MPGRDGIETMRALAALGLKSAVIIMSVEPQRVLEAAGMLGEMQGLTMLGTIAKPLTVAKLEPLILGLRSPADTAEQLPATVLEADLPAAFARHQLRLAFQPKVSRPTAAFRGVEALVRWNHPELGPIPPASFVPMMEGSEHYNGRLAEFSFWEALVLAGAWRESGRELHVAVNLSARALELLELPDRFEALARTAGVPTALITLELTETQIPESSARMIDSAVRLRLKGFALSLDDFGTGHSGLAKLERFPFTELKIDRQFVHGCSRSPTKRSVVEASLALARNLSMTAVAEGVEDRADWDLLGELGCDVVQGYFVARPMAKDGLDAWTELWKASAQSSAAAIAARNSE
jgi:EAL domain-containing protein (putative c-di-GMP-specific phosphodiesterase class I)